MSENIIQLLVPFFILGIVVEAVVAKRRQRRVYNGSTMVSDLGAGIASQVVEIFLKVLIVLGYAWIYEHGRLVTFADDSPWPWLIAFVGIDLGFYWWHRLSHVVNVMWGVHVVHHHSEDFNLSVALRQPAFELATAIWFYAPLALLGVPAPVWVTMYALNLFFQFWVHTELVGRIGPLEGILNTPSAHRVHHGINPKYLDKNYGGIFMLWDRLFGTYQREEEPVVFGVTKPLRNFNPVWANFEYFAQLAKQGRGATSCSCGGPIRGGSPRRWARRHRFPRSRRPRTASTGPSCRARCGATCGRTFSSRSSAAVPSCRSQRRRRPPR
jgi:alkylglycerol monooxygenase